MIGYRPVTRIITVLLVCYFLGASIQIMSEPASDIRVGGFVLSLVAVLIFRLGYRSALKINQNSLIIDQPWVRWIIPKHTIKSVTAEQGIISILTTTREIYPFAFTHSLVSNIVNKDKHRRVAVKTINNWRFNESYTDLNQPKIWSLKQVLFDVFVFIGSWQIIYSIYLYWQIN